jgi:ubiquinol-cytochrome c reductase cytochrome b subunit
MRFWAAVVITSLLRVFPYVGYSLVYWVWGGFSVTSYTLKFFFVLHFIIPFLFFFLIFFHLYYLHKRGRTSYNYLVTDFNKVRFFPYYWSKDSLWLLVFIFLFIWRIFFPFFLGDYEIFNSRDPMSSPRHIVPEWYYLIFYAILRSIYNKSLGIVFIFFSIFFLLGFLFIYNYLTLLDIINKFFMVVFFFNCLLLGWVGSCYVEYPFLEIGFFFFIMYLFIFFLLLFFFILLLTIFIVRFLYIYSSFSYFDIFFFTICFWFVEFFFIFFFFILFKI